MKTAMQLLYEDLEGMGKFSPNISIYDILRVIGNHYIAIEKEQIIDSGNNCSNVLIANEIVTMGDHEKSVGENYYDQRFKPESKA
jgi:hypothetical protein